MVYSDFFMYLSLTVSIHYIDYIYPAKESTVQTDEDSSPAKNTRSKASTPQRDKSAQKRTPSSATSIIDDDTKGMYIFI